jgi:hypothetical protein
MAMSLRDLVPYLIGPVPSIANRDCLEGRAFAKVPDSLDRLNATAERVFAPHSHI